MHPLIDEIVRCKGASDIRPEVFRSWQDRLRGEIQAQLDELAAYKAGELPLLVNGERKRGTRV